MGSGTCADEARRLPRGCWLGTAESSPCFSTMTSSCQDRLGILKPVMLSELWISVGFLSFELLTMLSGLHSAHNKIFNGFGALGHAWGCGALALFEISGASCSFFHFIFIFSVVLPFCVEILAWIQHVKKAYPMKMLLPPV